MTQKLSTRTLAILRLCETPRRYTDLKAATKLSDAGLYKKLNVLMEKGWIRKLPDGSYVLTEAGRNALEEVEALEIVREAIKRYGATAVKEAVAQLMKKRIEEAVTEVEIVETLVRVLRAWATVTAYWLAARGLPRTERVGEEERRALSIIEATLRKVAGETWYRKHTILLYPHERITIESRRMTEGVPVPLTAFIFQEERERAQKRVEEELGAIRQERLNLLETSLREAVLTLLRLIEERKRELEAQPRKKRKDIWGSVEEATAALSLWLYGTIIEPVYFFP